MNKTTHEDSIKYPFKYAGIFDTRIEEEVTMKLHFHLMQKYLASLKDLDLNMVHCKALGL
jgi:hypothetical protein